MSKGLSVFVGILALVVVGASLAAVWPSTTNQGYSPDQPIPFSHRLHAGVNKIPCQYCHSDVEKSRHASVPSLNVCMNCHRVVKVDSPWIQEITKHFNENKPVEWVRIHELPNFVYFPHKRHVGAGVSCQQCHGPIETMDKVYQYAPLTMGWCMECHKGRSTPEFAKNYIHQRGEDTAAVKAHEFVAPVNCSTCHY